MNYVDPCQLDTGKALDIGWEEKDFSFHILESTGWGELKNEIKAEREKNELIHYLISGEELDRKASEEARIDTLIVHDTAPDEVTVRNASENDTGITMDFSTFLGSSRKRKNSVLSEWRRTIYLAEKESVELYVTPGASEEYELRPPEMLEAFTESLDGEMSDIRTKIEKNRKKLEGE